MLIIKVPDVEQFNETTNELSIIHGRELQLEHSLISISKWESKWGIPFIKDEKDEPMTPEQTIDYIRCMTLTQNVQPEIYDNLSAENINQIMDYINAPMTASWVTESKPNKRNTEKVTSELIYYWMISLNIPVEFQKWHLNRLLMLIRICNIKNSPGKKMSKHDILMSNAAKNAERRARLNSKG